MANKVKQFRFYGDGSGQNQPGGESIMAKWVDGTLFNDVTPITQLGVQSLPGTKFFLNDATEPIVIGTTGIYELDLNNQALITSLNFAQSSITTINDNQQAYVIVDILYDDEG